MQGIAIYCKFASLDRTFRCMSLNFMYRRLLNLIKTWIMKKYICTVCQWVYDPEIGDPEQGIEPGVAFEDLPEDYVCPLCGVGKEEFEVEE